MCAHLKGQGFLSPVEDSKPDMLTEKNWPGICESTCCFELHYGDDQMTRYLPTNITEYCNFKKIQKLTKAVKLILHMWYYYECL